MEDNDHVEICQALHMMKLMVLLFNAGLLAKGKGIPAMLRLAQVIANDKADKTKVQDGHVAQISSLAGVFLFCKMRLTIPAGYLKSAC